MWCAAVGAILALSAGCFHEAQPGDDPTPGNQPPAITDLSANPAQIFVSSGESATIAVTASDPDGDSLSYSWWATSGFLTGAGASVTYTAASCCIGVQTITVTVSDGNGGSAQQSVNVDVRP